MRVGIVGSGHIGGTLGDLLGKAGHEVLLGSRGEAGSVAAAVAHGDAVIFAGYFSGWPDFAQEHGEALAGKVVIDAANPVAKRDGAPAEEVARAGDGAGSHVQRLLPRSHVAKAFNTLYWEELRDRPGTGVALPISGEGQAAEVASALVRDVGFEPVVIGPLSRSARQDPDGPVYNKALTTAEVREALA